MSASATPAPWFSQNPQSGTGCHGLHGPVRSPSAVSPWPTRYHPAFAPGGASTMRTTTERPPSRARSPTATPAPAEAPANQSGTAVKSVSTCPPEVATDPEVPATERDTARTTAAPPPFGGRRHPRNAEEREGSAHLALRR